MMRRFLFAAFLVLAPRAALACPVCFGQSDAPMAIATNDGILAMLAIVAGVLGAFASFFIYLIRRARLAEQASRAPETAQPSGASGYITGEGTAQC